MLIILSSHFSQKAKDGNFVVEGRIYPNELLMRVGYLERGRLRQVNFELSTGYNPKQNNMMELVHTTLDSAGSLLEQYFENEENDFPREWKEFIVGKATIHVRHTTVNSDLEAEADRLLGVAEDNLVSGDDSEEELKTKISLLGLDEEE